MPVINGLSTATTRLANSAFATTFFPRTLRSVWPRLCGKTTSHSQVEPFAFLGAAPLLKLFQGSMTSQGVASYSINVPNPVWKAIEVFKRSQFEFDQTRTLNQRVGFLGVKIAQHWDYLLANAMLKGSTSGSQNFVFPEDGKTYTLTFDGQPLFSASHNTGGSATYSNIITGALPTTIASLNSQDLTVSANAMQLDVSKLVQRISTVLDDKGALVYPDFDPERQLVLVVPPCLWAASELAFKTNGTLGGSNGSSSGSTTNIGHRMVKEVIPWSLLSGCPDLSSKDPAATVAPVNATEYYAYVDGDFTKPWYFQHFMPIPQGDVQGGDPSAEARKILNAANSGAPKVTPESADVYAATEIDYNLGALGANAQEGPVNREEFFVSARTRGLIFPGPWFNAWKLDPTGQTN